MRPRRASLRRGLTLTFVGVGLATLVATAGVAAFETIRASDRADGISTQRLASGTALELSHAFDEWSNELLVASQNDALKAWYRTSSDRTSLRASIDASLVGLYALYPDLIHEACFIDAQGPEVARQVSGTAAKVADLSPDESANPFFAATLALPVGQVHQHTPYVSPDTHVWVVSNSTPIAVGGRNVALLHFETNLDPLRLRIARTLPLRTFVRVVDTSSERVVFRTDQSVPEVDVNAPLANQPLPPAKALTVPAGFRSASALVPFGPTNSNHWRVEVVTPAAPAVSSTTLTWLGVLGIVVTLSLVVVGWLVARRIVRPIIAVTEHAERMAAGDLTGRLRLRRRDELGRLAHAVDTASDAVTDVIRSLAEASTALGSAAADLASTGDRLATAAEEASRRAGAAQVASAAVDTGIQTLSAGTTQVASSITQIASGAAEAADVARGSVAAVDHAGTEITALATASHEIGEVVTLIATIAGQTNLLALNATIEAARAGEAGKGFAVVADEVKQLAQQTARATGDISARIAAIQTRSAAANESVDALGSVITRINELNSMVAQTVEEHARTASQMSAAAHEAALGSNETTEQIVAVAQVTTATADGAQASRRAADSLNDIAARIAEIAATFRIH